MKDIKLKIVFFSDTHRAHLSVKLPSADILVFTGDCSGRGGLHEIEHFLEWFSSQDSKYKVMIAGNHDFGFELNPTAIKTMMPKNITYLEDSGIEIEGIKFWGSPVQPWFNNWAFNRIRSEGQDNVKNGIKQHWDMIPNDTDILLTHGPSYGILDKVLVRFTKFNEDQNVGCKDLTDALSRVKPRIFAFGHIHETYGTFFDNVSGILHINSSIMDDDYCPINKPIVIDYSITNSEYSFPLIEIIK